MAEGHKILDLFSKAVTVKLFLQFMYMCLLNNKKQKEKYETDNILRSWYHAKCTKQTVVK